MALAQSADAKRRSLRTVLVIPFVLQIFAAVGLVGYLSFRNGQQAVNGLASQLRRETSTRIQDQIVHYLEVPVLVNQVNIDRLRRGHWSMQDLRSQERQLWHLMQLFAPSVQSMFQPVGERFALLRIMMERMENLWPQMDVATRFAPMKLMERGIKQS